MKIAVASNEEGRVAQHFCHCNLFWVFEMKNDKILSREKREGENIEHDHHHAPEEHEKENHHRAQIDLIRDCQAVICKGMGHRAAETLASKNIQPVVMRGDAPAESTALLFARNLLHQSKPHKCCCGHKHHHE